jgi:cob(I)alamin adenosyltransferase
MSGSTERYIQIYTGPGKGKTTAALGQAVRAVGRGLKTLMIMFMKDYPYGELKALHLLQQYVTVEQYGNDAFVLRKAPPSNKDRQIASDALARAREAMLSGRYDIVILDEICVAHYFGLVTEQQVLSLLKERPAAVELILTGRYCPESWMAQADLVTEMAEVKHYYAKGVLAREGFES